MVITIYVKFFKSYSFGLWYSESGKPYKKSKNQFNSYLKFNIHRTII